MINLVKESSVKIGFLALTMWLERYWQKLSGKADCWLGVVDPKLLIHLIKQGDIDKIVFLSISEKMLLITKS